MKKRGQAFLITAVIFIAIVSALIATHNFSKKTEFSTFPYVAEEIQIESEKVMDYSLVSGEDVINDFTKDVSDYVKKEDIDIYFITGDSNNLNFKNPEENPTSTMDTSDTSEIKITIKNTDYFFPKTQGKHFYFVMIKEKEIGGEKYVYTNA